MTAQDKPECPAPAAVPDVVLDTNVVLDWLLFADPAAAPLAAALAAGRLRWVATAAMLAELQEVSGRSWADKWDQGRERLLSLNLEASCHLLPEPRVPATGRLLCSDPADQKFIDLALAQRCAWLFSHDKALLKLARRACALGLRVAPPRDFGPPA